MIFFFFLQIISTTNSFIKIFYNFPKLPPKMTTHRSSAFHKMKEYLHQNFEQNTEILQNLLTESNKTLKTEPTLSNENGIKMVLNQLKSEGDTIAEQLLIDYSVARTKDNCEKKGVSLESLRSKATDNTIKQLNETIDNNFPFVTDEMIIDFNKKNNPEYQLPKGNSKIKHLLMFLDHHLSTNEKMKHKLPLVKKMLHDYDFSRAISFEDHLKFLEDYDVDIDDAKSWHDEQSTCDSEKYTIPSNFKTIKYWIIHLSLEYLANVHQDQKAKRRFERLLVHRSPPSSPSSKNDHPDSQVTEPISLKEANKYINKSFTHMIPPVNELDEWYKKFRMDNKQKALNKDLPGYKPASRERIVAILNYLHKQKGITEAGIKLDQLKLTAKSSNVKRKLVHSHSDNFDSDDDTTSNKKIHNPFIKLTHDVDIHEAIKWWNNKLDNKDTMPSGLRVKPLSSTESGMAPGEQKNQKLCFIYLQQTSKDKSIVDDATKGLDYILGKQDSRDQRKKQKK